MIGFFDFGLFVWGFLFCFVFVGFCCCCGFVVLVFGFGFSGGVFCLFILMVFLRGDLTVNNSWLFSPVLILKRGKFRGSSHR